MGKRKNIVIVAEGATDKHLKPISPDMIKDVLSNDLKLDTRVTTLGHVQRGGRPCAFDRLLATFQGVEAVEALLSAKPGEPSPVIGIEENKVTRRPLMEAVALTQSAAAAIAAKDFKKALSLRDAEFSDCLTAFRATSFLDDSMKVTEEECLRIGIIQQVNPWLEGSPDSSAASVHRRAV
jgi:6-phosphofructokinase 1